MEIDGELFYGFADVSTAAAAAGRYETVLTSICVEDPRARGRLGSAPTTGTHRVRFVLRFGNEHQVRSEEVEYEARCEAAGVEFSG